MACGFYDYSGRILGAKAKHQIDQKLLPSLPDSQTLDTELCTFAIGSYSYALFVEGSNPVGFAEAWKYLRVRTSGSESVRSGSVAVTLLGRRDAIARRRQHYAQRVIRNGCQLAAFSVALCF